MRKRHTIQRKLVLEATESLTNHPTALEIHQYLRDNYPGISVATVYSNLKSLVEEGKVKVVAFLGSADRYETNTKGHYHIKCKVCGTFCDLMMTRQAAIDKEVAMLSGYIVHDHDVIFQGICPECQHEKEADESTSAQQSKQ